MDDFGSVNGNGFASAILGGFLLGSSAMAVEVGAGAVSGSGSQ